jgi:uncharacterized protein YndB with AHSA1/START domain
MAGQTFVYVTYIRTTPERLWEALTGPEFNQRYWFGFRQESDWTRGASWKLVRPDGRIADAGEVIEADPPRRLVLKWRNEFRPELKAEGYGRCTFTIEREGAVVKLTVVHEGPTGLVEAVSNGWPRVLASLKSLLETGEALPRTFELCA